MEPSLCFLKTPHAGARIPEPSARQGRIINVTTSFFTMLRHGFYPYGVAKAGLDHLVRTWAAELQDSGVCFLSVDPGEMDTAMHAAAMPEADRASLADPREVAVRLADLMEKADASPSGSRLDVAQVGSAA